MKIFEDIERECNHSKWKPSTALYGINYDDSLISEDANCNDVNPFQRKKRKRQDVWLFSKPQISSSQGKTKLVPLFNCNYYSDHNQEILKVINTHLDKLAALSDGWNGNDSLSLIHI